MESLEYRRMYELEDTYWWFVGKRHLVRQLIRGLRLPASSRLLDAGCGTGAGLDSLERLGSAFGFDASAEALDFCRKRGKKLLVGASLEQPGIRDDSFDVITILDVLEHVEEDRKVLRALFRILRPGGILLITVPAYPFLWSEHDVALHHKRRYVAGDLREKVLDAGFRIRHMSGLVSSFLPVVVGFRLLQKIFPHREGPRTSFVVLPAPLNAILRTILFAEVELSMRLAIPFGVSLYVVAEKPAAVAVPVTEERAAPALAVPAAGAMARTEA